MSGCSKAQKSALASSLKQGASGCIKKHRATRVTFRTPDRNSQLLAQCP